MRDGGTFGFVGANEKVKSLICISGDASVDMVLVVGGKEEVLQVVDCQEERRL